MTFVRPERGSIPGKWEERSLRCKVKEKKNYPTFLISSIEISVPFLFLQVRLATEMSWMAYLGVKNLYRKEQRDDDETSDWSHWRS